MGKNVWIDAKQKKVKAIDTFAKGYIDFLNKGKTERECVKTIVDIIKDKGPISGIMTGLKEMSSDYALVLPCDSPFVSKNHVNYLFDEFNDSYDALIPFNDSENKVKSSEPLHGIYKKSNFELIEKLIQKDILNIKGLIEKINCKFIKIENKKL